MSSRMFGLTNAMEVLDLRITSSQNVKRFRGGLSFQAHRLSYHSTLGLRVMKEKRRRFGGDRAEWYHFGVELTQILSQSPTDATSKCHLVEVAFVWELNKETIHLPLGYLQRGWGAYGSGDVGNPIMVTLA